MSPLHLLFDNFSEVLLSYSKVVIHVGINDLRDDRVDPMNMINKLRNICSYLSEHRENLKIVLSSVLPTKIISLNHKVYDYNYMLYELSNSIANITFLNNYYLAGQDSKLLSRYERQSDVHDVHINDKGSAMFARAIRDRVFHAQRWQ